MLNQCILLFSYLTVQCALSASIPSKDGPITVLNFKVNLKDLFKGEDAINAGLKSTETLLCKAPGRRLNEKFSIDFQRAISESHTPIVALINLESDLDKPVQVPVLVLKDGEPALWEYPMQMIVQMVQSIANAGQKPPVNPNDETVTTTPPSFTLNPMEMMESFREQFMSALTGAFQSMQSQILQAIGMNQNSVSSTQGNSNSLLADMFNSLNMTTSTVKDAPTTPSSVTIKVPKPDFGAEGMSEVVKPTEGASTKPTFAADTPVEMVPVKVITEESGNKDTLVAEKVDIKSVEPVVAPTLEEEKVSDEAVEPQTKLEMEIIPVKVPVQPIPAIAPKPVAAAVPKPSKPISSPVEPKPVVASVDKLQEVMKPEELFKPPVPVASKPLVLTMETTPLTEKVAKPQQTVETNGLPNPVIATIHKPLPSDGSPKPVVATAPKPPKPLLPEELHRPLVEEVTKPTDSLETAVPVPAQPQQVIATDILPKPLEDKPKSTVKPSVVKDDINISATSVDPHANLKTIYNEKILLWT